MFPILHLHELTHGASYCGWAESQPFFFCITLTDVIESGFSLRLWCLFYFGLSAKVLT